MGVKGLTVNLLLFFFCHFCFSKCYILGFSRLWFNASLWIFWWLRLYYKQFRWEWFVWSSWTIQLSLQLSVGKKCYLFKASVVCPNVTERFASCILCVKNFVLIRKVCSRKHFIFTSAIKPLQSNISIFILHTVLNTFPLVLTRRICWIIKAS